jgi:hypothetical protein
MSPAKKNCTLQQFFTGKIVVFFGRQRYPRAAADTHWNEAHFAFSYPAHSLRVAKYTP